VIEENEVLWSLYQDHTNQGRHHEDQRTAATNFIVAVCGGTLGLVALDGRLTSADLPLAVFLVFLGCFGALLSAKHHERFWFHTERAREYRDALQKRLPSLDLRAHREAADRRSSTRHPILWRIRVFGLWVALHLAVALIGVAVIAAVSLGMK
jgi:hypothetical protein